MNKLKIVEPPKLKPQPDIKIEKGIPLQNKNTPRTKYPFPDMKVGDSFLVEAPGNVRTSAVATTAKGWGNRHGVKFACRKVTEGKRQGIRIWRTE